MAIRRRSPFPGYLTLMHTQFRASISCTHVVAQRAVCAEKIRVTCCPNPRGTTTWPVPASPLRPGCPSKTVCGPHAYSWNRLSASILSALRTICPPLGVPWNTHSIRISFFLEKKALGASTKTRFCIVRVCVRELHFSEIDLFGKTVEHHIFDIGFISERPWEPHYLLGRNLSKPGYKALF